MGGRVLIDSANEAHVRAVASALFDHEPRNREKQLWSAPYDTQCRYIDKAAWVLSIASQGLASEYVEEK